MTIRFVKIAVSKEKWGRRVVAPAPSYFTGVSSKTSAQTECFLDLAALGICPIVPSESMSGALRFTWLNGINEVVRNCTCVPFR